MRKELRDIEQQVNDEIRLKTRKSKQTLRRFEDALASAPGFFGDKYPEHNVRVVTIPDPRSPRGFYSKELCAARTCNASATRRPQLVSGKNPSLRRPAGSRQSPPIGERWNTISTSANPAAVASTLNVRRGRDLRSREAFADRQAPGEGTETQKRKDALSQVDELAGRVQMVKGVKLIAAEVANVDRGLRQLVDTLRQSWGRGWSRWACPEDGKVALIAGVTKDLTAKSMLAS